MAKILSNVGMMQLAKLMSNERSQLQEIVNMCQNKYSPEGNGPQKSMWTVCLGSGGKGDIFRGSGRLLGPLAWHAVDHSLDSVVYSRKPNPRTEKLFCLYQTLPSCAMEIALSRSGASTTMRLS